MKLLERKQRHNENLFEYVEEMIGLNFHLATPLTEERLVKIIKTNINRRYSQFFWGIPIYTLQEL